MPEPRLQSRLDTARERLLDLSLRNRLLNHRPSKRRGFVAVGEDPAEIFLLLRLGKKLSIIGRPDASPPDATAESLRQAQLTGLYDFGDAESLARLEREAREELESALGPEIRTGDLALSTNLPDPVLRAVLRQTYRDQRAGLEELGVNLLHVALGALEWYEADDSQEARFAPLVLLPVELQPLASGEFRLKQGQDDPEGNLSLAVKLHKEHRLDLPVLPDEIETPELDSPAARSLVEGAFQRYFDHVAGLVVRRPRWKVHRDRVAVDFFSFAKLALYRDLGGNGWPDGNPPLDQGIVADLLGEEGLCPIDPVVGETDSVDPVRPLADNVDVVDSDSSQALALLEARRGHTMVIEGPPGTGKSQTITNLLAQAVFDGKRVLFVAEKRAALEVVLRNLSQVGLGEACLDLHSDKTTKRAFFEDLRETAARAAPMARDLDDELKDCEAKRFELNRYVEEANDPLPGRGFAPVEIIGRLVQWDDRTAADGRPALAPNDRLGPVGLASMARPDFLAAGDLLRRAEAAVRAHGLPTANPFFGGSRVQPLLPVDRVRVAEDLAIVREKVERAIALRDNLAGDLRPLPGDEPKLAALAEALESMPDVPGVRWSDEAWTSSDGNLESFVEARARLEVVHQTWDDRLNGSAWNEDRRETLRLLRDLERANPIVRFLRRLGPVGQAVRAAEKLFALPARRTLGELAEALEALAEAREGAATVDRNHAVARRAFGSASEQSADVLRDALRWRRRVASEIACRALPDNLFERLEQGLATAGSAASARRFGEARRDAYDALEACLGRIGLDAAFDDPRHLANLPNAPLDEVLARLDAMGRRMDDLDDLVRVNQALAPLEALGIDDLPRRARAWADAGSRLVECFERSYFELLLREAFATRPTLAAFDRAQHEDLRRRFIELDRQILAHNRARVARAHWDRARLAGSGAFGAANELRTQWMAKRPKWTVRTAMAKAGPLVQDLKPIFMMSPLSVATFLPPKAIAFDLVVFDEASQVKPEDALSALARACQAIVVGDSRQMPPTTFFERLAGDDEDEETYDAGGATVVESILALLRAKVPDHSPRSRDLRWHYRSRHESLIASSNRLFYKDRLFVIPHAERRPADLGLRYHPTDGVYLRSRSRTNPQEAEAVIEAVARHLETTPELSLGVAAFSLAQQRTLEDKLDLLTEQRPELMAAYRAHHPFEPVFVKNLERIQGDERDVVLISVGYGKDESGALFMNFGPLNQDGGERRLNVLITRARRRCEVFANFRGSELRIEESTQAGVRALRTFLHYAETGELDLPEATGRLPQSPFEEAVVETVRRLGYEAHPQVGSAGFFVDIGVLDKEEPGRYRLGVECDGASYHSSRSARDRDRLRQSVLEDRGWRLHRIWSTDWFSHRERETERLRAALEDPPIGRSPVVPEPDPPIPTETVTVPPIRPADYVRADLSGQRVPYRSEIQPTAYLPAIRIVVAAEAPIHRDVLYERLKTVAEVARAGSQVRRVFDLALAAARIQGVIEIDGQFVLSPAQRHFPPRTLGDRSPAQTYPPEIATLASQIVADAFRIDEATLVRSVCRLLGAKATATAVEAVTQALRTETFHRRVKVADGAYERLGDP
ncbi:MAG: DUF3320 domain-containing protein [Fimbriimonadaceae bacterium]|nr:DUF3320 domain-containing protein [Fimbriimonadaceae bacterium]